MGLSSRRGGKQKSQRSDLLPQQGRRKVRKAKRLTLGFLLFASVKLLLACACLFRRMAPVRRMAPAKRMAPVRGMTPVRGMAQAARS